MSEQQATKPSLKSLKFNLTLLYILGRYYSAVVLGEHRIVVEFLSKLDKLKSPLDRTDDFLSKRDLLLLNGRN